MVTCRCGYEFHNSYGDSFVICPDCKRIYPNDAPDLYHPKILDELTWKCSKCGEINPHISGSCLCSICKKCGTSR